MAVFSEENGRILWDALAVTEGQLQPGYDRGLIEFTPVGLIFLSEFESVSVLRNAQATVTSHGT